MQSHRCNLQFQIRRKYRRRLHRLSKHRCSHNQYLHIRKNHHRLWHLRRSYTPMNHRNPQLLVRHKRHRRQRRSSKHHCSHNRHLQIHMNRFQWYCLLRSCKRLGWYTLRSYQNHMHRHPTHPKKNRSCMHWKLCNLRIRMSRHRKWQPRHSSKLLHRCNRGTQAHRKCHHRPYPRGSCRRNRTQILGSCHRNRMHPPKYQNLRTLRIHHSLRKCRLLLLLRYCSCKPLRLCNPQLQIRRKCRRHLRRSNKRQRNRNRRQARYHRNRKRLPRCRHRRKLRTRPTLHKSHHHLLL